MKVVTFNANGIRAAARKGFYEWLSQIHADFVCIQELKAQAEQLTQQMAAPNHFKSYFHFAEKKGYSGTAIYSRYTPDQFSLGLGWEDFDSEGRCVRVDLRNISIISIYLPSGSSSDIRQQFKEKILKRLKPVLVGFLKEDRDFIICGDINIAHKPIDLRNWKSNRKSSGFLPQERSWMDWLIEDAGFVDAFRVLDSRPSQYTWWSYRSAAYARNVGWRLDYQLVTENLRNAIVSVDIYKEEKFSDHAPLIIEYDYSPDE